MFRLLIKKALHSLHPALSKSKSAEPAGELATADTSLMVVVSVHGIAVYGNESTFSLEFYETLFTFLQI